MIDLVVDGNSLFARSWFAAQKTAPNEPNEAIKLAVRTLLRIMHPDRSRLDVTFNRSFFAWDSELARSKHREPKPPEYHETRLVLKQVLNLMLGTIHFEHQDHEGDEVVATVVYQSHKDDILYLVSGDKDLQQLQGHHCHIYCLNNKAELSPAFINAKFHVKRPNQAAIALAITGDPVDGIAGIRGWGPVRVKKLFEKVPKTAKFEEALNIIDHEIPPNLKESFYAALDRTLLAATVPNVPQPAPIVMGTPNQMASLEIDEIGFLYQEVYEIYAQ